MTITDEMVEKARDVFMEGYSTDNVFIDGALRAALEAVAPMLIAQGMREAAEECSNQAEGPHHATEVLRDCSKSILARAQELDPQ